MYLKSLDVEIAAYLRRENKTQEELAKEVGMSDVTFSRKRRGTEGREFTLSEISRVAKQIGLTTYDGIMADMAAELVGAGAVA